MATPIFLAKLLGLYLVLVLIGSWINRDYYRRILDAHIDSPPIIIFSGALTLISGLLILLFHNRWEANWTIVITLLACWIIFQGIVRLWFPTQFTELLLKLRNGYAVTVISTIMFAIGLFLLYQGFAPEFSHHVF